MPSKAHKRGDGKYLGVYYEKRRDCWIAKISINARRFDLGTYPTEFLAAVAYDNIAVLFDMETNFNPAAIVGIDPTKDRKGCHPGEIVTMKDIISRVLCTA